MRKWLFILSFLLPVLSCTREAEFVSEPLQEDGAPCGKVSITFSVNLPESSADTKALGEAPGLEKLYLAVFGSSGHYKEYIQADKLDEGTAEKTFYDKDGNPFTKQVTTYTFKAEVQLSNSPRSIHFLGNGPSTSNITIGNARDVLPNLLCNDPADVSTGETAFWQMIYLPEIKAATNADGEFLNSAGEVRKPGEDYKVSQETLDSFKEIALIRNWAKIVIRNLSGSHFEPESFAVVNVPKRGTFVPYGGKTGFIGPDRTNPVRGQYQTYGFDDLNKADGDFAYPGNLPEGTEFDHSIPDAADFVTPSGRVVQYDSDKDPEAGGTESDDEPAVYLYERPVPTSTMEPSYVIVYGKYTDITDPSLTEAEKAAGGVMCYYKVDLMADGQYYPIYRNFKYQIVIRKISSRGHATPAEAAASAGSADVSADVTASHLADISDGTRRMAIRPWMSYTFIEGDKEVDGNGDPILLGALDPHLFVKFYDDINVDDPSPNMDLSSVWCELTPSGGGVIQNDEVIIGAPVSEGNKEDQGWRPIRFRVNRPGDVARTQTLRILCKTHPEDANESPLYRDIILTLQPMQPMMVSCRNPRLPRYVKEDQYVDISIPDGLVESMFPLVFTIEPEEMTLSPVNDEVHLPVVYGKSINPNVPEGDTKPRFQFERTLTWEDYKQIHTTVNFADESRWKTFSCHFQTNCENSATEIWVANRFFYSASAAFTDFRSFRTPSFTTSIPRTPGGTVSVNFGVQKENNGQYLPVYLQLNNLNWAEGTYDAARQAYKLTPTQDDITLSFTTVNESGDVSVKLFSEDESYEPVILVPWHFSNVGFISSHTTAPVSDQVWGSNVTFGMVNSIGGKNVLFGFSTDAGNPTPVVDFANKAGLTYNGDKTVDYSKSKLHDSPYAGRDDYYWAIMTSVAGTTPASVTLKSNGYVEETVTAERFVGDMLSARIPANNLKSWFGGSASKNGIGMTQSTNARISFDIKPGVSDDGLVLEKGKKYKMTILLYTNYNGGVYTDTSSELASVQLLYKSEDGIPQAHLSYEIESPEESTVYQYPAHYAEYIWSIPRGYKTATIELQAPNNRDAVISVLRIWGFKAAN